ncbi:hypothetical protein N0V90_000622 [Kalmusia sp. IMI 367209]|nr:hypothetical protein N0V90_000622 [Kalmusia sp. IMI 367209]
MADPPPHRSPHDRPPAVKSGHHRFNIFRRSGFPRNKTLPVLDSPNASTASSFPSGSKAMGVPAAFPPSAPPTEPTFPPYDVSPSTPKTSTSLEGKKKGLFDALRPKSSHKQPASEDPPPLTPKTAKFFGYSVDGEPIHAPPPPPIFYPGGSEHDYPPGFQTYGGKQEYGHSGSPVPQPQLRERASASVLTDNKPTSGFHLKDMDLEAAFEDDDDDVPAPPVGHKKGNKLLDLLSFGSRDKDSASRTTAPARQQLSSASMYDLGAYDSETDLQSRASESRRQPKRRGRKKKAKTLDRMDPITETSPSNALPDLWMAPTTDASHGEGVHDPGDIELDIISHYRGHRSSTSSLPRSLTTPSLTRPYESDPHDVPEIDEEASRYRTAYQTSEPPTLGVATSFNALGSHPLLGQLQVQSPLQKFEHRLLDEAEERMGQDQPSPSMPQESSDTDMQNLSLQTRNAMLLTEEKLKVDSEVLRLRDGQEELKKQFRSLKASTLSLNPQINVVPPSERDDTDRLSDSHVSIRSSIDLDEEPEICEYTLALPVRVTPGMIKCIDIPAKKSRNNPASRTKGKEVAHVQDRQSYGFKGDDLIDLSNSRKQPVHSHVDASIVAGVARKDEDLEPFPPYIDNFEIEEQFDRPKRNLGIPREESLTFTQSWVDRYGDANQRPLSVRYDPDVLAERAIPPAPLPKDGEVRLLTSPVAMHMPPPIPRMSPLRQLSFPSPDRVPLPTSPVSAFTRSPVKSPQRRPPPMPHCIQHGHSFRPINLKEIPDSAAVGRLGVSPYLITPTGAMQHVDVTVQCDKCNRSLDEVIMQCKVPVCKLAACYDCALAMQEDRERRRIDAWNYNNLPD